MDNEKQKKSLQQILGFNSPTVSGISAATALAGIIWSASETNKMKTYNDVTKSTQANINAISEDLERANKTEIANLNVALDTKLSAEEANIRSGLVNRGITDQGQADTSVSRYRSGISGAYAAARTALLRAKVNAENSLSGAISNYYQDLAKKQYESEVSKYAAKMGIWGSLGGLTGAALDRIGVKGAPASTTSSSSTSSSTESEAPEAPEVSLPNPAQEYANPDQKAEQEA